MSINDLFPFLRYRFHPNHFNVKKTSLERISRQAQILSAIVHFTTFKLHGVYIGLVTVKYVTIKVHPSYIPGLLSAIYINDNSVNRLSYVCNNRKYCSFNWNRNAHTFLKVKSIIVFVYGNHSVWAEVM